MVSPQLSSLKFLGRLILLSIFNSLQTQATVNALYDTKLQLLDSLVILPPPSLPTVTAVMAQCGDIQFTYCADKKVEHSRDGANHQLETHTNSRLVF